jgi:indolepyruvate ferredoxin oxidoreductase alpha subunit
MTQQILLGDEAVALGAIHAGIAAGFSYPGTPATEILEFIERHTAKDNRLLAVWAVNEKVAYEQALGMSYAGRRAIVSMKHVGLNAAADPFVNSALTGANGGLVVAVADDPGMHSSQNEQDSRYLAHFALLPCLEPSSQQEAYEMTLQAFEVSEQVGLPIVIRLVTRLAHSRANVSVRNDGRVHPSRPPVSEWRDWTLLPSNARVRYQRLIEKQPILAKQSEETAFNALRLAGREGVICSGVGYNYVIENVGTESGLSVLKIGAYPLPTDKVRAIVAHCNDVLIVEDGYPFIEERLRGLLGVPGKQIRGKLSGDLPRTGELTPDVVRTALGLPAAPARAPIADLTRRPPTLCKGCAHADSCKALLEALQGWEKHYIFGDIGCYTLSALPPYHAMDTCVDMGASISMAHGAALAGLHPVCCMIGDSTFTHSGMTGLLGAARDNANMSVFILDNRVVAMTGGQPTMIKGEDFTRLIVGLGVSPEHVHVIEPHPRHHQANTALIRKEIEYPGLSVIICQRPCIQYGK